MVDYEDWARQILAKATVTPNTEDADNMAFCMRATELFRLWADDPAMVHRFANGLRQAVPELLKRVIDGEM